MILTPADAKRRLPVELDDGQIGYVLYVPAPHSGRSSGGRGNRSHGGPGGRIRVALESGAVISCDAERVVSRTISASDPHGGER